MTAAGCLLREDRELLNRVAMNIASTFIFDAYGEGVPDRFWSTVVATVEEGLVGACEDLELPSLDEVEAA